MVPQIKWVFRHGGGRETTSIHSINANAFDRNNNHMTVVLRGMFLYDHCMRFDQNVHAILEFLALNTSDSKLLLFFDVGTTVCKNNLTVAILNE